MWIKPKDVKERAKVMEDFFIKASTVHGILLTVPHCIREMREGAGLPKGCLNYYRLGLVAIDSEGIHFFEPPELDYKKLP